MRISAAKSLNVDPENADSDILLGIGALRMLHTICAKGFESTTNNLLQISNMPYEMCGFSESLEMHQKEVDDILMEIATENPEILQCFKSPYSRLGMIWMSGTFRSIRQKKLEAKHKHEPPSRLPTSESQRNYSV